MKEFVRWYRSEHLPHVLEIPGIVRAYRSQCTRRGVNWATLYILEDDASVQTAMSSPQADRARRDWEAWLQHVTGLSVEVYASLGPLSPFHNWN